MIEQPVLDVPPGTGDPDELQRLVLPDLHGPFDGDDEEFSETTSTAMITDQIRAAGTRRLLRLFR